MGRPPATRSPPVSSSRCSKAGRGTNRSGGRVLRALWPLRGSAPRPRCRPPRRWMRCCERRLDGAHPGAEPPARPAVERKMTTPIVIDCDPGHDDAIAILLALASPEVELTGVTTVAGNQTLEKTTRNALKILELAGRTDIPVAAGADRPLVRDLRTAANVHGESGLDGPDLPEPTTKPVATEA